MVSTLNSALALGLLVMLMNSSSSIAAPNYKDALAKSILFFQGQRSGKLPKGQLLSWRSDSGLRDGSLAGVDLTGGYYDAGDNVKFNFPMAYTTTMLSWGVIEFGGTMSPTQLSQTRTAIQWATNYFLKCVKATPGRVYVGVGDPNADHKCWERPEDMDTVRSVYYVSSSNPGSDVAAEMAAALASASIVFRVVDAKYSAMLLANAKKLFTFANQFRGSYNFLGGVVCPFYCSYSGYKDELLWGASWLYKATKNASYLNLMNSLGANDATDIFSWDNKFAGARVLLSRMALIEKNNKFDAFRQGAEDFMCKILPQSPYSSTKYTPGGLMYKLDGSNLQYVTSITFLLTAYAKYMAVSKRTFLCGHVSVSEKDLRILARRQVDYILGSNPLKMSYMVGYGNNYPKKIHHRGSSLPSVAAHRQPLGCSNGFQAYYYSSLPNPNVLIGAIVGGPNQNDAFSDDRTDYSHTEPATYINAAIVGPLAYFAKDK